MKRILSFLCEQGDRAPKEYDIAVGAMNRPPSFDSRTDPIVRVSIASIRERLWAYFTTEGSSEPWTLEIPKGQYRVGFTRSAAAPAVGVQLAVGTALSRLWSPYLDSRFGAVIVYTEPLFFRNDEGLYLRDLFVNNVNGASDELRRRIDTEQFGNLLACFHYLSAGEVNCMLSLTRMFHERHASVETRNSRISSWNELRNTNLILLGSPRTNPFLDRLQGDGSFVVLSDRIENRNPRPYEEPVYRGYRYMDGTLSRMTDYAVVTRRPGPTPGSFVTIIGANHGRAIEGAGHFLTLEDKVESLLDTMTGGEQDDALPRNGFQALMRVDTVDVDDEVVNVECVASRRTPTSGETGKPR